jgi:hypothetical protein
MGSALRRFAAALDRLGGAVWLCGALAVLCAAVGTVLFYNLPHRLFPDSMTITVT